MNTALIIATITASPFLIGLVTALVVTLWAVITGRDPWMENPKPRRSKPSSNWHFPFAGTRYN